MSDVAFRRRRIVLEDVEERRVDVVGRRQAAHIRAQVAHYFRVLPFERRRESETHVGHALFVLALHGLARLAEAGAVVGHHDEQRVVEVAAGVDGSQEGQGVLVDQLQVVHAVMTQLRVEQEAELGLARVHGEEVSHPVEHVDVPRQRAEAVGHMPGVLTLRLQVERAHVVVDRLCAEAEHAVLEGPEGGAVLPPLGRVAGVAELLPDPRVAVDPGGSRVSSPRLRQLDLVEARQYRQKRLRRAVAHNVVRVEHDAAEDLREVAVCARQHAHPRHVRRRVEAEHEHVKRQCCRVGLARRRPTLVHPSVVGDPRQQVAAITAIASTALRLEEVASDWLSIAHVCDSGALCHRHVVRLTHQRSVGARDVSV